MAAAISPDAKQILIVGDDRRSLSVVPTGAGAPRTFSFAKLERIDAFEWTPDGRGAMIVANEPGRPVRTWQLDVASGGLTPITEEGTRGRLVSPDGQWLTAIKGSQPYGFNLKTKTFAPPVKGIGPAENLYGWTPDSASVFVGSGRIFQVNMTTGVRVEVLDLNTRKQPGFVAFASIVVARDGDRYAYSETRQLSQLFLLKIPQ